MKQKSASTYMEKAIRLAMKGMQKGHGGPFGAVIVKGDEIVGKGWNQTFRYHDPTAHAEVQAIRDACKQLKRTELAGCVMYCTGEPCPMCMAAIYWAMVDSVWFANTKEEAALAGFDDSKLYRELQAPWSARALSMVHFPTDQAIGLFRYWQDMKEDHAV